MHQWNRTLILAALCLGCGAFSPRPSSCAQDFPFLNRVNPEDSNEAVRQFRLVDAYVAQHAWPEAVELLSQIIESYPHQVVPLPESKPTRYVSIRTYCQHRLTNFPSEGRELYRERVDSQARSLWDRYVKSKDARVLMQIVDEFYASSVGDDAAEALGDHYSGRGDLAEAVALWERLLPRVTEEDGPTPELHLRHPDVSVDIARLWAKWSIVQLMRRNPELAQKGLEQLQRDFPQAVGSLGGRQGSYADIVHYFANNDRDLPPVSHSTDWTTFGGDFTRSKVATETVTIGTVDCQWNLASTDVAPDEVDRMGDFGPARFNFEPRPRPRLIRDGLHLSPVTWENRVFVCDGQSLYEFEASSEEQGPIWQEKFPTQIGSGFGRGATSERHTLTVTDRYLLARSGRVFHRGANPLMGVGSISPSQLYCFDHRRRKLVWWLSSESLGLGAQTLFEGAPVIHAGESVIVGLSRVDAMTTSYLASIDLETGRVQWTRLICEATNDPEESPSPDRNLLTLAGDTVFVCTNRGAIAAVDLPLAKVKWLTEYEPEPDATLRRVTLDINPCVYHEGRLTVAPAGAGAVMGLDAQTGKRLWRSRLGVEHLLGAHDGLVFVTGKRVYALDEETGGIAWRFPTNEATGVGRGILAGDKLYWPTATEIHVLDQRTGGRAAAPISLLDGLRVKSGNLVPGKDFVVLAEGRTISVLRSYRWLKEQRSLIAARNPDSAEAHYYLAEAAHADEDYDLAAEHYGRAAELAPAYAVVDGQPLKEIALAQRFQADCRRALLPAETNSSMIGAVESERRFLSLADRTKDPRDRFILLWRCARLWEERGEDSRAQVILRRMLDDAELLETMIPLEEGRQQRGQDLIAERYPHAPLASSPGDEFGLLVKDKLASLLTHGLREKDAPRHDFARGVASTPIHLDDRRQTLATVGGVITSPGSGDQARHQALLEFEKYLTRCGFDQSAKRMRVRIAEEFPQEAKRQGSSTDIGTSEEILRSKGKLRIGETWRADLGRERMLIPAGDVPSAGRAGIIVTNEDKSWGYMLTATGGMAWTVTESVPPSWSAYSPAGLVCRFADRVAMLDLETGAEIWSWNAGSPQEGWIDPSRDATAGDWRIDDDYCYWITEDGLIRAIDLYQGKLRWQSKLPGSAEDRATFFWVSDRDGVVVAHGGYVSRFDRRVGRPRWSTPRDSAISKSPLITQEGVVVFFKGIDELVGVKADSGEIAWRKLLGMPSFHPSDLSLQQGYVMLEREGYWISMLDPKSGEVVREFSYSSKPRLNVQRRVELASGLMGIETEQDWRAIDSRSGHRQVSQTRPGSLHGACSGDWLRFEADSGLVRVSRYNPGSLGWETVGAIQEMEPPAQLLLAEDRAVLVGSRKSVGVSISSE